MGPTLPAMPETAMDRLRALGDLVTPAWMRALEQVKIPTLLDTTKIPGFMDEFERRLDEPLVVEPALVAVTSKRGRRPDRREAIKPAVRADIEAGKDLTSQHQGWAKSYGVDRTTFVAARDEVLREMGRSIPRKRTRIARTK